MKMTIMMPIPRLAITIAFILVLTFPVTAQPSTSNCDPNIGRMKEKVLCLSKLVHVLNERVSSLEARHGESAKTADLSAYLKASDLDDRLRGYVKYGSPLAINLVAESSTSQQDGRCLSAEVGEVGVLARRPCNFDTRGELIWQFLRAPNNAVVAP